MEINIGLGVCMNIGTVEYSEIIKLLESSCNKQSLQMSLLSLLCSLLVFLNEPYSLEWYCPLIAAIFIVCYSMSTYKLGEYNATQ